MNSRPGHTPLHSSDPGQHTHTDCLQTFKLFSPPLSEFIFGRIASHVDYWQYGNEMDGL